MSKVPDKALLQQVNQRVQRTAGYGSRVSVSVARGDATLAGSLEYEAQRRPILRSANAAAGVRRVIDQMRVEPKKKRT
ncbi:MAG: BON domain-containing protein [Planctomycetes bacterium]|nr:BON domain-containing protein [Planctomycetota bacterium]